MITQLIESLIRPKLPSVEGWDERCIIEHDPCEGIESAREMTGIEKVFRGYHD